MERVPTGIKGFDELVEGGLPLGSTTLVSGSTGTCKTIFAQQYVYAGASKYNEPGLYVTVEGSARNIAWDMESFDWDIRKYQDSKKITVSRLRVSPDKTFSELLDAELETIRGLVEKNKVKRLVVDSTTAFGAFVPSSGELRSLLFRFSEGVSELGCTTIMTSETKNDKTEFSAFGVEEFVADGVVALYFVPPNRIIFVRKMRGTKHSKNLHPFDITPSGIDIKPKEQVMWEAIK